MKNDKLLDALKAFELKNHKEVKGGTLTISYQSGHGISDVYDSAAGTDVLCGIPDSGTVGSPYQ
jgi:hypothetical protein